MAESTETSPLLREQAEPAADASPDVQLEANHQAQTVAPNQQRAIKTIRILLFATSIAATCFGAASLLICRIGPFNFPYYMFDTLSAFMLCIVASLLFSSINLKWNVPYVINLIADLGIAFFLTSMIQPMTMIWPSDYLCRRRAGDPDGSEYRTCIAFLRALEAVMGVSVTLAALIFVFHLALFVLRTFVVLKQRSAPGASQLSLWLPTGEVTFSVTVRVLRQERGMESPDRRAALNVEYGTLPAGEEGGSR